MLRVSTITTLTLMLCYFGCSVCLGASSVDRVTILGDASCYGMVVEDVDFADGGFNVSMRGASFQYDPNNCLLVARQRIGVERQVLRIHFQEPDVRFESVTSTLDSVILDSEYLSLGIYGDSTLIINPRKNIHINIQGFFAPDYVGYSKNHEGELILIDDFGGVEMLPQREEAGYEVEILSPIKQNNWEITYALQVDQRIMLAVFPGKNFDEKMYLNNSIVHTSGSTERKTVLSKGGMPPDSVLMHWKRYVNTIVIHSTGLYWGMNDTGKVKYNYPERTPGKWAFSGPYQPVDPFEVIRFLNSAHSLNMKVLAYVSPLFHYKTPDSDAFIEDVKQLLNNYEFDGLYIDTLYHAAGKGFPDDKIKNWTLMRQLREIVGGDGLLFLHGTGDRSETSAVPNVDALADFTMYGELVPFKKWSDPYIQYKVRKIGISNSIAFIKADKADPGISQMDIINQMLSMKGMARWVAYSPWFTEEIYWPLEPQSDMRVYFKKHKALQDGTPLSVVLDMN